MADNLFQFEEAFADLEIGATSSFLKTGALRSTIIAISEEGVYQPIVLDFGAASNPGEVFEEARRYLIRSHHPIAYGFISQAWSYGMDQPTISFIYDDRQKLQNEIIILVLWAQSGESRGMAFPVRRKGETISFDRPWKPEYGPVILCPIGDIWRNPLCVGDLVRTRPGMRRLVEPGTELWETLIALIRLRIHGDQPHASEYQRCLDDIRNSIYIVHGRDRFHPGRLILRPRTLFNPLGFMVGEADSLILLQEGEGAPGAIRHGVLADEMHHPSPSAGAASSR